MLDEYYKGIMVLPPGNGISDGSVILISFYLIMGMVGNGWTRATLFSISGIDIQFYHAFAIVVTFCQVITAL